MNFRSPLVWDFFAISTYLTGSLLFLALPMIPDFAIVRDHSTGLKKKIYGLLALGWRGTTRQWNRLETAMSIMAIAIIPVAVSVHTIVSFDFSMAPVPMWHSTMFGPYFVAGAIFSGIAGLIIAMATLRKFLHLHDYLHPVHFENLGKLLLLMSLLWGYFVFAERLTVWYGNESAEIAVLRATQKGSFAPLYWTMVVVNFVIPVTILAVTLLAWHTGSHQPPLLAQTASTVVAPSTANAVREWDTNVNLMVRNGDLRVRRERADTVLPGRTLQQLDQYENGVRIWGASVSRQLSGSSAVSV